MRNQRLIRYKEKLLGSNYLRIRNYTSAPFLSHIYSAYTLRHQNYSWRSYMKGFVEATQGADLCRTEPSHRAIGGQTYKKKHKSM